VGAPTVTAGPRAPVTGHTDPPRPTCPLVSGGVPTRTSDCDRHRRLPYIVTESLILIIVLYAKIRMEDSATEADWWAAVGAMGAMVGTLIGVLFAAAAAGIGLFLYRVESKRDSRMDLDRALANADQRARAEEAKRAQADKVSCWYGTGTDGTTRTVEAGLGPGGTHLVRRQGAWVLNTSGAPIYNVLIQIGWWSTEGGKPCMLLYGIIPNLQPNSSASYFGIPKFNNKPVDDNYTYAAIYFRDQAERHWKRDYDGLLTPCSPPPYVRGHVIASIEGVAPPEVDIESGEVALRSYAGGAFA
jgi:hypothetical protein